MMENVTIGRFPTSARPPAGSRPIERIKRSMCHSMNMLAFSLTTDQARHFRETGYLVLPRICPPDEVVSLKKIIDRLFAEKIGWEQGAQFDMLSPDDGATPPSSLQIIDPVVFAPELRQTQFRRTALAMARQLLGPDARCSYEHAIYKPPYVGGATPWHQDEAFHDSGPPADAAISIWMPLQDVTDENGCLRFIPGSHLGEILSHRSPNNDPRIHSLECDGAFDAAAAVSCPLAAGGATIHHSRTLHAAGPNTSASARSAYVLTFSAPRQRAAAGGRFAWNQEKRTARLTRREKWRKRGGALGRAWRKLKTLLTAKR
jgi:hypothetical protein